MTDLPVEGPAAPPRVNGEVVFEAPWQRRAFGIAVDLCEQGAYEWRSFQQALIGRVAEAERGDHPFDYWQCWLNALGDVVEQTGLVALDELDQRSVSLAARPAGHDHEHGHPHR